MTPLSTSIYFLIISHIICLLMKYVTIEMHLFYWGLFSITNLVICIHGIINYFYLLPSTIERKVLWIYFAKAYSRLSLTESGNIRELVFCCLLLKGKAHVFYTNTPQNVIKIIKNNVKMTILQREKNI